MAAKKGGADAFANMATITVTESAANTLTFKKLETGASLMDKIAWIVHRIEYYYTPLATVFDTTGDNLAMGISTTNTRTTNLTTEAYTDPSNIDLVKVFRQDVGTAASGGLVTIPYIRDFSALPSGGLIMPPAPLYGFAQGSGLASAATIIVKCWFTTLELSTDEYWQLVEARRLMTA